MMWIWVAYLVIAFSSSSRRYSYKYSRKGIWTITEAERVVPDIFCLCITTVFDEDQHSARIMHFRLGSWGCFLFDELFVSVLFRSRDGHALGGSAA